MGVGSGTLFAMTNPLQTVSEAEAESAVPQFSTSSSAIERATERICLILLRGGVFRGQCLQPFDPENGHLVFLRLENRVGRPGADTRIETRGHDLRGQR